VKPRRARSAGKAVPNFPSNRPGPGVEHYDLHTAYRSSQRSHFALYAFCGRPQVLLSSALFLLSRDVAYLLLTQRAPLCSFSVVSEAQLYGRAGAQVNPSPHDF